MILYSRDGIARWYRSSDDFRFSFYGNHFAIPKSSLTHCFYNGNENSDEPEVVLAADWFPNDFSVQKDQYLYEHTITHPSINACLTFLWEHELNFQEE